METKVVNKIIECKDENSWYTHLNKFYDSTLYQTPAFAKNSKSGKHLLHLLIMKDQELAAIAQFRIKTIPFLNRGIAYSLNGPVYNLIGKTPSQIEISEIISLLINEICHKRKLVLVVKPYFNSNQSTIQSVMLDQGFKRLNDRAYNTIMVDLRGNIEEIRKSLKQKWRNILNKSEKSGLELKAGRDLNLFSEFMMMYNDLLIRKKFEETVNVSSFSTILNQLPETVNIKIFIAYKDNVPAAGIITAGIGKTGVYLFGASNSEMLNLGASYLLQWKAIEWLKSLGCEYYDLGGIDKEKNPGVYHFKSGMGGNEVESIGTFEYSSDLLSKLFVTIGKKLSSQ